MGLFLLFFHNAIDGFCSRKFFILNQIAAGIILIGSCSSGLASNVMVYLAKANLLSVIVTAMYYISGTTVNTLLMKTFAGKHLLKINFVDMMLEIVKL